MCKLWGLEVNVKGTVSVILVIAVESGLSNDVANAAKIQIALLDITASRIL